jgi:RNA polymerase sigma-70 factor (ECF subfamily)
MAFESGSKSPGEDAKDIEALLAGERHAFDRLVTRHADRVFNLCYRLLGDRDEADDCAQDVFIKVFRNIERFRSESSFSTWIYSIAVNTCRNRRKSVDFRFWRTILRFGADSTEEAGLLNPEIEDPAPSPLTLLTQREQETLLQKAMDGLPQDQKTVIVLRHVEGLSYEEICQITGYNPGTLKSKLARARRLLHKKMQTL